MNCSDLLSICIPTYNRADRIKRSLDIIIPIARKYNIKIYISDNASVDDTKKIVENAKKFYANIYYYKNAKNLGYACNFATVIGYAKAKYVWMIGDDDYIVADGLDCLVNRLEDNAEYDLVVVNGVTGSKMPQIKTRILTSPSEVMGDLMGQLTWISSLIFSRKIINAGLIHCLENESNSFPHTIAVLKLLTNRCKVLWISNICVAALPDTECSYSNKVFNIFLIDWFLITERVKGKYSKAAVEAFLNDTPISWRSFYFYRISHVYNWGVFIDIIKYIFKYPKWKEYLLCAVTALLFSGGAWKVIKNMYKRLENHG